MMQEHWEEYLLMLYQQAIDTCNRQQERRQELEALRRIEDGFISSLNEQQTAQLHIWLDAWMSYQADESFFAYRQAYGDCIGVLRELMLL